MAIRMTGMISGLDTESLIQSLVDAQRLKNKKTVDKKTKLEWTQDKWKELNTKLYSLYKNELNSLTLQKSFMTKKASVTDESKVSITAGSGAPLGSQTLSISQLASSGYLTGSEIDESVTKGSKLSELGITGSSTLNLTVGDKSTYIEVNGETTIASFVSSLQGAGINANFDEKNHRFFLSSKQSGLDNDFALTSSSAEGTEVLQKLGLATGTISDADKLMYQTWASNAVYAADGSIDKAATIAAIKANDATKDAVDSEVDKRVAAYTGSVKNLTEANEALDKKNQELTTANTGYNSTIDGIKDTDSYKEIFQSGTYTEDDLAAVKTGLESEIEKLKADKEAGTITEEEFQTQIQKKETQKSQITEVIDLQEKISKNSETIAENQNTMTENTTKIDELNAKLANDNAGVISEVEDVMVAKADYAAQVMNGTATVTGSATKVNGQNAKFKLNGVEFESNTNETTVNGVTLTMKGVTNSDITFNVTNDTQAVYDNIKNFVNKYNEILKEMNDLYYADSSRGYDPLSDDEKEAMTDDQIEKWETKIKDSLLRRDNTLGSVSSAMKNALLTSVEVDGKKYSLSSFGVGTSSVYLERGLLHIQGDSEDSTYANYTNKLMEALEEDPDTVMQVFNGVAQNLYKTMQDKMKGSSLSSALTFYNDVYMKNQITALNKQISKDEDKLTALEDKYYKQFAAMEAAMAKMQSQQNSLSAYL